MIIRLHNLSARAPMLSDLAAVVELVALCSTHETLDRQTIEDDLRRNWRKTSFHLACDAWVIINREGEVVGYASVQRDEALADASFVMCFHIHPAYTERGIETLLTWLVEVRTRQLLISLPANDRATLRVLLSCTAQTAVRDLFVREGYQVVRRFWRLFIAMEHVPTESRNSGQFRVDVDMTAENSTHAVDLAQDPEELYSVHQYEVYEKVLRAGKTPESECTVTMQCATAS